MYLYYTDFIYLLTYKLKLTLFHGKRCLINLLLAEVLFTLIDTIDTYTSSP